MRLNDVRLTYAKKGGDGMIASGDSVTFESRSEVGYVLSALEDWLESGEHGDKKEAVKRMVEVLDHIEMCW